MITIKRKKDIVSGAALKYKYGSMERLQLNSRTGKYRPFRYLKVPEPCKLQI